MDLDATPAERRQLEYATQHFSFTPDSLTDTITTFALENLEGCIASMRGHCTKLFANKVPAQDMADSFALIEEKYTAKVEKVMDDFSSYARKNILTVPADVVLPEDRVYLSKDVEGYTGQQMSEDTRAFDKVCDNSRTLRYKLAILEAKLSNLRRVREVQIGLGKEATFLEEASRDLDTVVDEKTKELESKMVRLRALINRLECSSGQTSEKEEEGEEGSCLEKEERRRKLAEVQYCSDIIAKRLRKTVTSSSEEPSMKQGRENQVCLDNTSSST